MFVMTMDAATPNNLQAIEEWLAAHDEATGFMKQKEGQEWLDKWVPIYKEWHERNGK